MDIKDYNLNSSEEELIKACQDIKSSGDTSEGKAYFLNYFWGLLNLKQQSKTNKKLVVVTWVLAIATWILAGATILLVFVTRRQ